MSVHMEKAFAAVFGTRRGSLRVKQTVPTRRALRYTLSLQEQPDGTWRAHARCDEEELTWETDRSAPAAADAAWQSVARSVREQTAGTDRWGERPSAASEIGPNDENPA